jgi:hypothetical protein
MTERRKLELQLNQPTEIELLYDEPVVGKSQFGDYFLYAVKTKEAEFAFFAPEEIHQELQAHKKGDKVVVTKLAAQRGTKLITKYVVESNVAVNKDIKRTPEENEQGDAIEEKPKQTDQLYSIMLNCYKDAFQIQTDLNGMVDIEKIAITLFIARSKK